MGALLDAPITKGDIGRRTCCRAVFVLTSSGLRDDINNFNLLYLARFYKTSINLVWKSIDPDPFAIEAGVFFFTDFHLLLCRYEELATVYC